MFHEPSAVAEPLLSLQIKLYTASNSVHMMPRKKKLLHWEGNQAAAPSPPQKNLSAQPAHRLKVLTLLFIRLTFRPRLKLALTPAQVHNAPRLGPDRMPRIPAAWVYSRSEACQQRAHEESSSCRNLPGLSLADRLMDFSFRVSNKGDGEKEGQSEGICWMDGTF
ncbi:hypothetical protein EYF80_007148 [Liparis tanakae]|uniref:Uncharacterized protein n=1 Tax=Liparis tanakae TaxID=230148 RepID=A0A4Z2IXC6_9TELE|nr:hypothetical protein EYF80_007148 [Liparis tanakae]